MASGLDGNVINKSLFKHNIPAIALVSDEDIYTALQINWDKEENDLFSENIFYHKYAFFKEIIFF